MRTRPVPAVRSSALRSDEGQSLVFFAILIGIFFLVMLVVIDGTHAFDKRRNLQTAADAAALAAAYDLANGNPGAIQSDASNYSLWNDGPSPLQECDSTSGVTENCYVKSYGGDDNTVEVLLKNDCVSTFFGQVANFVTQSSGFSCIAESAHAIAAVSNAGSPPPYTFMALMGDGEQHTLYVDSNGDLNVNDAIYVNACAGDWPVAGACPGGTLKNHAFEMEGSYGSLTAQQFSIAGGWESPPATSSSGTSLAGLTVSNENPIEQGNYNPPPSIKCGATESWPANTSLAHGNTDTGCPLVGKQAHPDPLQGLKPPPLNDEPSWCLGCANGLDVVRVRRTGVTATVWTDGPLPASLAGASISINKLFVNGVEDSSFEGDGFGVTGFGKDTSDSLYWIQFTNGGPPVPAYGVTTWSIAGGTATLTTDKTHAISPDDTIDVEGVNPNLDGDTFTAKTGTSGNQVVYDDPSATSSYKIDLVKLSGGTATITLDTPPHQQPGDPVTIQTGDPVFDGTYPFQSGTDPNTITYTPPAYTVDATNAFVQSVSPCASTCVTVTALNHLSPGDTVDVVTGSGSGTAPYSVTSATVLASPPPTLNQFSYQLTTPIPVTWSVPGGTATATITADPSVTLAPGLSTVTFSGTGLPGYLTNGPLTVVPGSQSGNTFTVTLNTTHAKRSGTASMMVTAAAIPPPPPGGKVGSVTVTGVGLPNGTLPATIPATATAPMFDSGDATGTGTVSDTNAYAPASGVLDLNGFGSPGQPRSCYPGVDNCQSASCQQEPGFSKTICLDPGTYYGGICIGITNPDPMHKNCADYDCSPGYLVSLFAGTPPTLTGTLDADAPSTPAPTEFKVNEDTTEPIVDGDVIKIDNEWMQVNTARTVAPGIQDLTVVRGYAGSGIASHDPTSTIVREDPADNVLVKFNNNSDGSPGIYIMAGGGLHVCGSTGLESKGNFIYNTDDWNGEGYLGQIEFNTSGPVTLSPPPQGSGPYQGITIMQDRNDVLTSALYGIDTSPISYSPALKLDSTGIPDSTTSTFTSTGGDEIQIGDVIEIGSELMLVTDVKTLSPTSQKVTVVRGYLNQPAQPHQAQNHVGGSPIQYVTFTDETCNEKTASPSQWDLALMSMKSTGADGALGNISGTFYLPSPRAVFGDQVSGTAELAVYASCITIHGANSTFNAAPAGAPTSAHTALVG